MSFGPNAFVDPTTGPDAIPSGFAPFGVKNFNGTLFVTYAKQDAAKHDDVAGVGNGFIDEYDTSGNFIRRFATRGLLNSPIGATIAPANFGTFSNDVLIGNFGDSHVNAFDSAGNFLGQLTDPSGNPLVLNGGFRETDTKGLWGIGFGNGAGGAGTNTLFFAAGINQENDGLFGTVTAVNARRSPNGGEGGNNDQAAMLSGAASGFDHQTINDLFSRISTAAGSQAPLGQHDDGSNIIQSHSPGMVEQDTGMTSRTHASIRRTENSLQTLSDQALTDFKLDLSGS